MSEELWNIVCLEAEGDCTELFKLLTYHRKNIKLEYISNEEAEIYTEEFKKVGAPSQPPFVWVNDDYVGGYEEVKAILQEQSGEDDEKFTIDILKVIKSYDDTKFNGSPANEIAGLVYLSRKHKDDCILFSDISLLTNDFYKFQIIFDADEKEINAPSILWDNLDVCKDKKKRFVIILLGLQSKQLKISHLNALIYDSETREMERFEPNGISPDGIDEMLLDELLVDKFSRLMGRDYIRRYYKPLEFCPNISYQLLPMVFNEKENPNDPAGFCAVWSLWYIDLRLSNPTINRAVLVKKSIEQMVNMRGSFTEFIRNYSMLLYDFYEDLLKDLKPLSYIKK